MQRIDYWLLEEWCGECGGGVHEMGEEDQKAEASSCKMKSWGCNVLHGDCG